MTDTFGTADDFSDPDGIAILSFWQAQAKAREQMVQRAHNGRVADAPRTVKDSVDSYIEFLESHRKSAKEARYAADAFILPALGKIKLDDLTADQVRKWHVGLAKAPARVRTKKGGEQKFRLNENDPERERRRKSTANRILTILKAALNRSWRDKHVTSDRAWRSVEPFRNAESARIRYLSLEEATRFINASEEDFRKLVRGALESGARYGELCDMLVADFNSDAGTVSVPDPKTGKPRHIVLSADGVDFFEEITAGRTGTEPIFLKADGSKWLDDHQADPIRETNKRAKITPSINFHGLRHTWASHAVMNGMPLIVVAKNLGHSTTRMVEKHYGHLAPSYVAQAVRAHAPKFGAVLGNVRAIRRKKDRQS
ncbi:tyrosine-type recombinase/integrase [Bradyrhizobium sp. AZCC 1578]|uniref:tyrosine-type recombinase/integrase n=1 Tax=Bradyrhizobium sp. AZCC 1578 TaxID=3117027 RepID=UPI002FF30AA9